MKESRFIELINLYIDRQIGPEEAAELEAEIARSPAHRRTYLQYCRMHRACTLLFENFRAPATPLAQALTQAEDKADAFPTRGFRLARIALGAGLAAAACVAFMVVNHPASISVPAAKPGVDEVAQVNVPPESFRTAEVVADARPAEFQTVFAAHKYSLASNNQTALDAQRAAFDWMKQIELSPMPAADNSENEFGPQPEVPSSDLRFRRDRHDDGQPAAEMAAFEFQR
jgi:anti-sigma factor RsiW